MLHLVKTLINAWKIANEFECNMNVLDGFRKNKKLYKIKVTEDQIKSLRLLASLGINCNSLCRLNDMDKKEKVINACTGHDAKLFIDGNGINTTQKVI